MPDSNVLALHGTHLPEEMTTATQGDKSFAEWLRKIADSVEKGTFPNLERACIAGYDYEGKVQVEPSRTLRKDQVVAILEIGKISVMFR